MVMDVPRQRVIACRGIASVEFGGDARVWPDTLGDIIIVMVGLVGGHRPVDELGGGILGLGLGGDMLT